MIVEACVALPSEEGTQPALRQSGRGRLCVLEVSAQVFHVGDLVEANGVNEGDINGKARTGAEREAPSREVARLMGGRGDPKRG